MKQTPFAENLIAARNAAACGQKVYGIFGSPVSHSLSPLMHNTAFALKGINALYLPFCVEKKNLKQALACVRDAVISGLNITLPLKEEILGLCDDIAPEARTIGSVNTLVVKNDRIKGYNTDLHGFTVPLKKYIESIQHESVTVFGGGGSARTVLYALLQNYSFPRLTLITRNARRGNDLLDEAESWKKSGTVLEWADFNDKQGYPEAVWESRLLINTTPIGMTGSSEKFPPEIVRFFHPGQIAYDLIYSPLKTSFISEAEKRGGTGIAGLDMFIGQGAKSFRMWTRKVMPQDKIREVLIEKLSRE